MVTYYGIPRWVIALLILGGLILITMLTLSTPVLAQGQPGDQFHRWTAQPAPVQLANDATSIPIGQGSVFVPSLSDGADEPEALIYQGERQIATGRTGRRIVMTPGRYTVRIGSGPDRQLLDVPVEVLRDETAVVPVRWGGLKIEVVDENNIPHRGSYELIRVEDRQPYTVGYGADTLQGERLQTLIVPPGLYRIVRPGANYRARRDFSTVVVPEGGLVHYKLVMEPGTGQFQGAGVVLPEEVGVITGLSPWN